MTIRSEFSAIFERFTDYTIAIVGSALKNYDRAKDIDVLFPASENFRQLAKELAIPYKGKFVGDDGSVVRQLKYRLKGVGKPINLIQRSKVEKLEDWPHQVLFPNGQTYNTGVHYNKTVKEDEEDA